MKLEEIKSYFDEFCINNEVMECAYSFYYFYLNIYKSVTKEFKVYNYKNAIFIIYIFGKSIRVPYLPLVKFNVFENQREYLKICNMFFKKIPKKEFKIISVPNNFHDLLDGDFKIRKYDTDYIYSTEQYVFMAGAKFKPIRRYYNKFVNNYKKDGIIFKEIDVKNVSGCLELINNWAREAKEDRNIFRVFDTNSNRVWINNYSNDIVPQRNYCLLVGNKIVALTGFFETYPNADHYYFFISKNDFEYDGSMYYIIVESFRDLYKKGILKVNYAGSIGMNGLKQFKLKLKPIQFLDNYNLFVDTEYDMKYKVKSVL